MKRELTVVMVGEVDHGKSSVLGRLLADQNAIAEERIENVRRICAERGKRFEYAFLLDAFEEEQRQGITIDITQLRFSTPKRDYRVIDAPGHREFLKNMVSGSASASAAILLIDAKEGVREQSLRHSYLLKLLGVRNIIVLVNKMDLVGYAQAPFDVIKKCHSEYLGQLGLSARNYIPASAIEGVNLSAQTTGGMPWYKGPSLLEALEQLPQPLSECEAPLRFPVQDVYKFDERRIVAGRVESGRLEVGQELTVWPSERKIKLASIERWSASARESAEAGESVGLTFSEQAFIERGDILTAAEASVPVSNLFDATIFWMGKRPLQLHNSLRIKLLTQEADCQVVRIHKIIDTGSLKGSSPVGDQIGRHEVAEITLRTAKTLALDAFAALPASGRFVLVADGQISGGGIVSRPYSAFQQTEKPASQNIAWEFSEISALERAKKNGHRGAVIWLTGLSGAGKSMAARYVENALFKRGCQAFVLDGDNIRNCLNSDLDFSPASRSENLRRTAEVAKLFCDAGMIVITAFISPFARDRERARKLLEPGKFFEVFLNCPLAVCEQRDAKGLYKKARAGLISDFTGISSPFEVPTHAELILNSDLKSPRECGDEIIRLLEAEGIFGAPGIMSSSPPLKEISKSRENHGPEL